jgi:hypothetical protein
MDLDTDLSLGYIPLRKVDGCEIPHQLIDGLFIPLSIGLKNHPFGGAGFCNHPQYDWIMVFWLFCRRLMGCTSKNEMEWG